jgi:hypothetical protein
MTARVLRPVITLTTVMAILAAAIAAYAFLTAGTTHADSTYNPKSTVKFCNDLDVFPPDPALNGGNDACNDSAGRAAGAHPNITTKLQEVSGDLNFSNVVTNSPLGQTVSAIPVGTEVGGLHSDTTLGTFNGPCNFVIGVDFLLFNVALPDNPGDPRSSTNIAFPRPEGSSDRFGGWQIGSPPSATGGTPVTETGPSSGYAAGSTMGIQNYPSHLLNVFDADYVPGVGDGPTKPLVPTAVYGGLTHVVTDWIPLYFVLFPAGALTGLPQPLGSINANMGQPNVSVLNDPSAAAVSPSGITDFCTPLTVWTMLLGSPGGNNRVTNPATATTWLTVQYNASLRDLDQDGYENAFDACPKNVNVGAGRLTSNAGNGDSDADGIDNSCDTTTDLPPDSDGDGYYNRQDNCPQVDNGIALGTPAATAQAEADIASPAADKGPRTDTMGDPCDNGTVSVSQNGSTLSITLSPTVGNGRYMSVTNVVAKCVGGGTDGDNDGYCQAAPGGGTTDPGTQDADATKHSAWSGATHPALQMDSDGDGTSDAVETYIGTDPTKGCAQNTTQNNEQPFDNWIMDFNDNALVNGQDVGAYGPAYNKPVSGGPYGGRPGARYDLNVDGIISGGDVGKFGAVYNKNCAGAGVPPFSQQ